MSFAKTFTDLQVWQESHKLTLAIYKTTARFPQQEKFGLTSQLTRAAGSVGANITEGFERGSKKEFIHFLTIARGSLAETENHLLLARDLGYLEDDKFNQFAQRAVVIHKLINALIRSLRSSPPAN